MKLIKFSILALLIIAIIPTSQEHRYSLYAIMNGAVQDLGGFCDRKPEACKHAQNVAYSLKDKLIYIGNIVSRSFEKQSISTAALDSATSEPNQDIANHQRQSELENVQTDESNLTEAKDQEDNKPIDLSERIPLKKTNYRQFKQVNTQDTLRATDKDVQWQGPSENLESENKGSNNGDI